MPGDKKSWGIAFGDRGAPVSDPVSAIIQADQADAARRRMERKDEAEQLEHQAKVKGLKNQISGEDEVQKAQMAQENEQLKEEVHKKEIQLVEEKLGSKIDQLGQSLKEGADKKTISDQVTEIRQVATELGMGGGGSKFEDVQAALDLVEKLRPPSKTLPDQVKEARDLIDTFGGQKTDGAGNLSLEIEKVKGDRELAVTKLNAEIAAANRQFQLEMRKWDNEREDKKAIAAAELMVKKEGNQLLADVVEKLATIITAAAGGAVGAAAGAGAIAGARVIEAGEEEAGEVQCPAPGCGTVIPISTTDSDVICAGCGTRYNIERMPKATEEAPPAVAAGRGKKK